MQDSLTMLSEDNQATSPQGADEHLADRRIVLDCRWLGMGGAGRVTELLLREFQDAPPPGDWILWGRRSRIEALTFGDARITDSNIDPHSLMGQRAISSVPHGDLIVYLHQIRPLHPGPSVTVIHDTIPLRHGGSYAVRALKRAFFVAVARFSTHVLTDSQQSARSINRDLSVPLDRITVMRFPIDHGRAERISIRRTSIERQKVLLYVGRFNRHKNLPRLCAAFQRSRFAAAGGHLLLVGGSKREVEHLEGWLDASGIKAVEVRGACSEDELDDLLTSSTALIMPSLEEGYGLPAFEAAATGLPVATSRTGAMVELPDWVAVHFDANDVEDMTRAIDEVTSREPHLLTWDHRAYLGSAVLHAARRALGQAGARP